MGLRELLEEYPDEFIPYAEKILDSYFGNLFVSYKNERILYVNAKMAASVHMTKEELTGLSLEELRGHKFWMRSLSQEMYGTKRVPFNAYNVSRWGEELFTHVEPISNDQGEVIMGAHYSIPRRMLDEFSDYVSSESSNLHKYKDISEYLENRRDYTDTIICTSPAARIAFENARHISALDSIVLICGETGTGKDVLANYIYHNSRRVDQPFIPVNCSAIPEGLMESEFFGYERGAFTGARSSGKPGLFELADHGTLFLDELEELSLPMQAKLLRVLETGRFMRVGGTREITTDVRIIAATNRELKQMVAEKQFREDLYYRMTVMPLYLPPLRERREDIVPLAESFLSGLNRKYSVSRVLTEEVRERLEAYNWPGNIRELRNVVERYAISGWIDIPAPGGESQGGAVPWGQSLDLPEDLPLHEACSRFEQAYVQRALDACGGSVAKAAERLGIHRSLLYRKLKQWEEQV